VRRGAFEVRQLRARQTRAGERGGTRPRPPRALFKGQGDRCAVEQSTGDSYARGGRWPAELVEDIGGAERGAFGRRMMFGAREAGGVSRGNDGQIGLERMWSTHCVGGGAERRPLRAYVR